VRILEEPYFTADGTLDFPFAYVFDASALTDGNNLLNVAQQLQGDSDFVLRRIIGVPTVIASAAAGGRFNYKNARGAYACGNPTRGICFPNVWPVVPEKLYRVNDQIGFDLYDILRASIVCAEGTILTGAQIAFLGVKRFGQGSTYPKQVTPYQFREVPYTYSYALTIDWPHFNASGIASPARRFIQQMENFDFELLSISISRDAGTGTLLTNDFQVHLYDANMHQFSDKPLNQSYINSGRTSPSQTPPYQATFPTPSQIYPRGAAITFDITSMLCSGQLPRTYNIAFQGIWRYPCQ
jgi:hypothetical protein